MFQSLDAYFSGPVLPASVLMLVVCAYWILMILGAFDFSLFDFDLDLDGEPDSILSFGMTPLRFLNIGQVPFMLWMSALALSWWTVSMLLLDRDSSAMEGWLLGLAVLRNFGLGLVLTKIITQPLRGRFDAVEPNPVDGMIGRECVITTSEATPDFGEARFETGAAPLILNVRTADGTLAKGEQARIVDHDPDKNIYFVTGANKEV